MDRVRIEAVCGLVGAFAFADTAVDELTEPVRHALPALTRRGPDDQGVWTDGVRCALGFRRLAILDLTPAGHQPMVSVDGRHVLVFNGEIYNYRELRDELVGAGHVMRSTGDAEVLLSALRHWGTDALQRLDGMFALALYDLRERRLLLARDHAGIKPLHVAHTPRGLVFASQHDRLLAHPWCRGLAIDPDALGLYLRFGFVPAPHGMHAATGQVRAGELLEADATGRTHRRSWFTAPRWQRPTLRGGEAREAFEAAFARSVARQLVADVPVGVFLSGGVDSPLVAAEAAARGGRMRAFTIGVEDTRLDETADARRFADELGLEHVAQRVTAGDALALLDDVVAATTEPTADYSMFPTLLVSRLARNDVTVVLSGDGGDELYWGYPSRFGSTIAQARYFGWPRPARLAAVAARRMLGRGTATRDVLAYASVGRLYQRKHTLMSEADLARVFPALPALPASFDAFRCDATEPDEVAQWVRWNEWTIHLARVLAKVDRASMYCSLEVRVPLLGRDVLDVAWRTDWRTCLDLDRRVGKQVLRDALARRVRHATAGKRGFEVPMADWLTGPLEPRVRELLLGRTDLCGTPVRTGAILDLYARLRAGDRSKAWGLWMLLALALWERAHGKLAPA